MVCLAGRRQFHECIPILESGHHNAKRYYGSGRNEVGTISKGRSKSILAAAESYSKKAWTHKTLVSKEKVMSLRI
ncbi:hypothetical protein PMJ6TS7_77480 (plasmid) [Paenibacillus melissococcoides]